MHKQDTKKTSSNWRCLMYNWKCRRIEYYPHNLSRVQMLVLLITAMRWEKCIQVQSIFWQLLSFFCFSFRTFSITRQFFFALSYAQLYWEFSSWLYSVSPVRFLIKYITIFQLKHSRKMFVSWVSEGKWMSKMLNW